MRWGERKRRQSNIRNIKDENTKRCIWSKRRKTARKESDANNMMSL